MEDRQIESVWINGYGEYYVTGVKETKSINHFKSIDVFLSPCGIKIVCAFWNGRVEVVYTTHASVKYASESESNNES